MALTYPANPSAISDRSEREVFELLAKLPDDCMVYYEPAIERRYPDFIVIIPDFGVLIIEVKGWSIGSLVSADPHICMVRFKSGDESVPHPIRQARKYMFRLVDKCKASPNRNLLVHQEGERTNKLSFPFAHISILSNITTEDIRSRHFQEVFPEREVIFAERLKFLKTLSSSALKEEFRDYFSVTWKFEPLTGKKLNALRATIHPFIVIDRNDEALQLLDKEQEEHAKKIGAGHRLIYGPVGTGKTIILLAKARLLAEDPQKRILALCFNRPLGQHLKDSLQGFSNVTAMTFYKWAASLDPLWKEGESKDELGLRLLTSMKRRLEAQVRYDAVLIDEAQDFPASWFRCAVNALNDPEDGDLLVVGDGRQATNLKRNFSWSEVGIRAQGRITYLEKNYRNTKQILVTANMIFGSDSGDQNLKAREPEFDFLEQIPDPGKAKRVGAKPLIVRLRSRKNECDYAAALIETWLLGGCGWTDSKRPIEPRDIAILYSRINSSTQHAFESMIIRLKSLAPVSILSGKFANGDLTDDAIKILTMQSCKGLQFSHVILLWSDLMSGAYDKDFGDPDRSLFIAATRAENLLVVLYSEASRAIDRMISTI